MLGRLITTLRRLWNWWRIDLDSENEDELRIW